MGSSFTLPLREPMWFSYYGPIYHTEASDALDAAIASHLQEIGAGTAIPIRSERVTELVVPVALNSPPFHYVDDEHFLISFATSSPGTVTIQSQSKAEHANFGVGLKISQVFPIPSTSESIIKFEFDVSSGVSSRSYWISTLPHCLPSIIDDKIVVDGVTSTVSKIYRQEIGEQTNGTEDDLCLICCSMKATVVALPCRHCCMCRSCSEKFASISTHCPVCRSVVHELVDWVTTDDTSQK